MVGPPPNEFDWMLVSVASKIPFWVYPDLHILMLVHVRRKETIKNVFLQWKIAHQENRVYAAPLNIIYMYIYICIYIWPCHMAYGILVTQPGMEPTHGVFINGPQWKSYCTFLSSFCHYYNSHFIMPNKSWEWRSGWALICHEWISSLHGK